MQQTTENTKARKKRGQALEIWKRFKRNPIAMTGLVVIIALILMAAFAPLIAPGDGFFPGYNLMRFGPQYQLQPPSADNWFGTDQFGRCQFNRIVHGARTALYVGFVVVGISMTAGVILGSISGFYGGVTDNVIMRVVDVILAIPNILLAISIAAVMRPGLTTVMVAVGIGAIPGFARQTRAACLSVKEQEYVEAARSVGASDFRILRKHILPNCMAPIIIEATMGMAGAILAAAALSFLGLGLQPPSAEWGAMLSNGRAFMLEGHTHMTLFPGLFIALVVFSLNLMGDGLRDAFDPKLRTASLSRKQFLRKTEHMRREIKKAEEA